MGVWYEFLKHYDMVSHPIVKSDYCMLAIEKSKITIHPACLKVIGCRKMRCLQVSMTRNTCPL